MISDERLKSLTLAVGCGTPICYLVAKPFDLDTLQRPVDPALFRLAQNVCECGWESEDVEKVRFENLSHHAKIDDLPGGEC